MREAFQPVEIVGEPRGPLLLTCEHAGSALLPPLRASEEDAGWLHTHWGQDLGAAALTRAIARQAGCGGVLSRFSRLVCDPNRRVDDPTWIREEVEGRPLSFNQGLDQAERRRREALCHAPYHRAVYQLIEARLRRPGRPLLLSVHSFTPLFMGQRRSMEAGVLFDSWPELARQVHRALADEGLLARLNEPYSGLEGLIHSVALHGARHALPYLELEVRNDLLADEGAVEAMATRVLRALGPSLQA